MRADSSETGRSACRLFFHFGQLIQRPSEQYNDGFSSGAKEGKLQITGIFHLSAKLAKLICHRVDNIFAAIREHDLHVAANHLWTANVQQLPSDGEPIALRLQFDLEIDLIRVSPVEQLSDGPGSRTYSCQDRLRKAVVYQLNHAACFLSRDGEASSCECCLDEGNFFRGRLVTSLGRRRVGYFLPKRCCLHETLSTCSTVRLHRRSWIDRSYAIHKVIQFQSLKVHHLRSPISLCCRRSLRSIADVNATGPIEEGERSWRKI